MASIKRYSRAPKLSNGRYYGTFDACYIIYRAAAGRAIDVKYHVSVENDRLDILAHQYYRDGTLWWVIAGASGIGWNLQVPPGTLLIIPTNIGQIAALLG